MSRLIRSTSLRLPDENKERHATWLEIFFDLIFAVIVVQLSDRLFNHFTFVGLIKCAALLIPSLWTWVSYTVFAARFDNNDALHWLMTFITMFAGVVMAIQIPTALESGSTGFSIGFILSQIVLITLYLRPFQDKAVHKHVLYLYIIGFGLGITFWIASLFFDPPKKFIFWILGMCIYLSIPWIGKKKILSKAPLDTTYIPERFGAFIVIILGQIIASVVFGLESANWDPHSLFISIQAFILAILIWGQYYQFNQIAEYKCTLGSGQPFIYSHVPLILSLIFIGVCTRYLISNTQIQGDVKHIFCFSLSLYLASMALLHTIAIPKIKRGAMIFLGGVAALWALFYGVPFSPLVVMSGTVFIFSALFIINLKRSDIV